MFTRTNEFGFEVFWDYRKLVKTGLSDMGRIDRWDANLSEAARWGFTRSH